MNRAERRRSQRDERKQGPAADRPSPMFESGVSAFRRHDLDDAERHFRRCLGNGPEGARARFNLGVIASRRGRHAEAVPLFRDAVALKPIYPDAWLNLGLSLTELKDAEAARAALSRATDLQPTNPVAWSALAQVLADRDDAERACRRALDADPAFAPALYRLADLLRDKGDHAGCLACCDALVAATPAAAEAFLLRGHVHQALGHADAAEADYREAARLDTSGTGSALTVADSFTASGRHEEAVVVLDRVVATNPDHGVALMNRAVNHQILGRFGQALDDLKRSLELIPDDARVYFQLGNLFLNTEQAAASVDFFLHAVRLKPDYVEALFCLAKAHTILYDFATTEAALDYAITIAPGRYDLRMELLWSRINACHWQGMSETLAADVAGSLANGWVISPFKVLGLGLSNLETLLWTRAWSEKHAPRAPRPVDRHDRHDRARGARIRLGYVSADFRNHATAFLITELFERHDRARFEVFGYNIGYRDESAIGARMVAALDHVADLTGMGDREAAQRIADDRIDLLVDLKGYTFESRANIFSYRPAPIQVNYLGYPGTTGSTHLDYIVVDDVIAPADHQPFYDERIVRLPNSYQPNVRRPGVDPEASRAAHGLPDDGFVFCCFNNAYKITPLVFDIWMRLLGAVPGSVLWLFQANEQAHGNLRREAEARGVAADRLVFAPRAHNVDHLARQGLADLFLDTLPIGAHTTASDALWAGVPVVTCLGPYFPGRVAASLLHAVGLPELVTTDFAAYEALALDLATNPERLGALRARLARNRDAAPLFDMPRYARNFEAALARMVALHDAGLPPEPFRVDEIPPEGGTR